MPDPTRPSQVRPTDPLIRWVVRDEEPPALVASGSSVAWLGRASRPGEKWVTAIGEEPEVVVGLVESLCDRYDIDGVTVSASAYGLLPDRLRSPDPGYWSLWTLDPADWVPEPTGAIDLAMDDPRIAPLLEHSDSAHIFPGHERLVRWAGIEDGERLIAVAGAIREESGAAHLVSVCTHPDHRGRGLAGQACSLIMHRSVDEGAPMLVLEMYAENDSGGRAYSRLGFQERSRFYSGLLAHALDAAAT